MSELLRADTELYGIGFDFTPSTKTSGGFAKMNAEIARLSERQIPLPGGRSLAIPFTISRVRAQRALRLVLWDIIAKEAANCTEETDGEDQIDSWTFLTEGTQFDEDLTASIDPTKTIEAKGLLRDLGAELIKWIYSTDRAEINISQSTNGQEPHHVKSFSLDHKTLSVTVHFLV